MGGEAKKKKIKRETGKEANRFGAIVSEHRCMLLIYSHH